MLFLLTGKIQTGKTRWLENALDQLAAMGVESYGVIAPGIWRQADDGSFDKLGIDNVLLPNRETVPFARRAADAVAEGVYDECSQSARAQMAWAIDDAAIATVNAHFERITQEENGLGGEACRPALLVVDELGRLELLRGEGLASAMALIDRGATQLFPHALCIVREDLLDVALTRFANASWGGIHLLTPTEESLETLYASFRR